MGSALLRLRVCTSSWHSQDDGHREAQRAGLVEEAQPSLPWLVASGALAVAMAGVIILPPVLQGRFR